MVLRHVLTHSRQKHLVESVRLMAKGNLVIKIKRFVRTSVPDRRKMSKAQVKGRIITTETNMLLSSRTSKPVPASQIPLIGYLD